MRSSAASRLRSIAGDLLLNGIPQRLIDDRRVFARMELAFVNDLAEIGAVLQHQVERAAQTARRRRGARRRSSMTYF